MSDRYYVYYNEKREVIGWKSNCGHARWYDYDYPAWEGSDEVCVYYFKDNSQEASEAIRELLVDSPGGWVNYLAYLSEEE